MTNKKFADPGDQVIIHHIRALHTLIHHWPPDHIQHVEQAWLDIRNQLHTQQRPWYHVKGPMAATLAYLKEWGWTTDSIYQWHETAFMTEAHINLQDDWPTIERVLHHEAQQQRTSRLASKRNCQNLVSGLDWTIATKAARTLPKQQVQRMKTWNQAALHYRQGDQIKTCPLCGVPATPKHIVWLCAWHHNQGHPPLEVEWTERLQDPLEEPLWAYGWIPQEPQDHLQLAQPLQGHGCWSSLEPLPLQPWQLHPHLLHGRPVAQRHHHWHGTRAPIGLS